MRRILSLTAFISGALVALPAGATVLKRAPLAELAQSSAVIVHAVVRRVDDEVAPTPQGPFRTQIELEVLEAVKGLAPAARTLALDLPGGRGFGRTMAIPGMPRFSEGDEVVLLLEATPRGGLALTGLSQGAFFVRRAGEATEVVRELGDVGLVGHAAAPPPRDLSELLTQLRRAARGGAR